MTPSFVLEVATLSYDELMFIRLFAVLIACALSSASVLAAFPEKPVRIVVPFSPGGGTDLVARTMAPAMAQELGQAVLVENKPGASTILGTDFVAKSLPDGYTLVMATLAHVVNPTMQAKLPYSHATAFASVMLVGRSPNVLVVRVDGPLKSVKDILVAARQTPGRLTFASQGAGTSAHLAGELFKSIAKVDLIHVAYKGAGPALTDVIGGQVDMMFATAAAVGSLIDAGKLRALAVTTAQRSTTPDLAKIPTIAESGVVGYEADSWYGLFAPAGTPAAVIERLNAAAKKAVQSDAFKARVASEGLIVSGGSAQEFDRYAKEQELRWRKVIKDANISLD